MKVLVPIKRVVDPYAKVRPLADGSGGDTTGARFVSIPSTNHRNAANRNGDTRRRCRCQAGLTSAIIDANKILPENKIEADVWKLATDLAYN